MEGTALHDPRTRRGWIWLIVAGFAVSVAGIIVGLQKAGSLCGSPLIPQSRQAEIFDALRSGSRVAGECYRRIDAAAAPTWMLIAAGIVVVLAAVIIRVVSINRYSAVEAAPSLATQIEDLERQYREGLISTEEFDVKRARLLDQL
ncbi:hypothetical protein J2809_001786 [Arthrobacter pascens]|uniref:SHOCT domain-containing protein n=1 Tax=Arthrobacter pascens TaxID=1677 RepID=UPI00285538F1|nr:SHOCT domain-containing protein [Arthrobacter pascens]MDR6557430.1 hypothetical protein [Arthrobacter pascens]